MLVRSLHLDQCLCVGVEGCHGSSHAAAEGEPCHARGVTEEGTDGGKNQGGTVEHSERFAYVDLNQIEQITLLPVNHDKVFSDMLADMTEEILTRRTSRSPKSEAASL